MKTRGFLLSVVLLGTAITLGAMIAVGAISEPIPGLPHPGRWVPWVLMAATQISRLALALVVGFLILALFLMPSGARLEGLAVTAVRVAAHTAIWWAVASGVTLILTMSEIWARPVTQLTSAQFTSFLRDFPAGLAILIHFIAAVIVAIVLRWTLHQPTLAFSLGLAVASVIPLGLTGHAAGSGSHGLATMALITHVVGVAVWVGGLIALAWLALRGSKRLRESVERFSPMALVASISVIGSGVVGAVVNLGSWDGLTTGYGALLGLKIAASVVLVGFGFLQRRAYLNGSMSFLRLALSETFVLVAAFGLGVALGRTERPVGETVIVTPGELLIGVPMPPEPTLATMLTGFYPNGFGLCVVAFGAWFYLWGVSILRKRGVHWPVGRTVSWLFGLAVVGLATFGGLGLYSPVMFSQHMIAHMMLAMIATIFLVLGAPMTLALRTLPAARRPGEYSPRAMLNGFLHSRYSRIITHPVVAAAIFMGSLYAIYFTSLFEFLMRSHAGHTFMEFHFLLSGFLFFYVLIGVDPSPRRIPPLARLGVLMVSLPFHAFFGVALMGASSVIAESYYATVDRPYATDLLADQQLGGGITWGMGEFPLLIVTGAMFIQWIRSDRKESRRRDRAADRDGDAELEAYNAMLNRMAEAEGKSKTPNQ